MKKNVVIVSALALLTACASSNVESDYEKNNSTSGQGGVPSIEETFKMDTNQDGKLEKSEVSGGLLKDFEKVDANGDGFITKEELSNAPKPSRGGNGQRPPQR